MAERKSNCGKSIQKSGNLKFETEHCKRILLYTIPFLTNNLNIPFGLCLNLQIEFKVSS